MFLATKRKTRDVEILHFQLPDSLSNIKLLVWPSAEVFTWLGDQVMTGKSLLKSPVETMEANEI